MNKWDIVPGKGNNTLAEFEKEIRAQLRPLSWATITFTSAVTGAAPLARSCMLALRRNLSSQCICCHMAGPSISVHSALGDLTGMPVTHWQAVLLPLKARVQRAKNSSTHIRLCHTTAGHIAGCQRCIRSLVQGLKGRKAQCHCQDEEWSHLFTAQCLCQNNRRINALTGLSSPWF